MVRHDVSDTCRGLVAIAHVQPDMADCRFQASLLLNVQFRRLRETEFTYHGIAVPLNTVKRRVGLRFPLSAFRGEACSPP